MSAKTKRIIFTPAEDVELFLQVLDAGKKTATINTALRLLMNPGSETESGIATTDIFSPAVGTLALNKKPEFSRGESHHQVLIQNIKNKIYADVKAINKPSPWDDLLNIAANAYLIGYLFRVYIFSAGSQLRLLENLYGGNLAIARVQTFFYDPAAAKSPAFYANWTFEDWLKSLIDVELIAVESNICKLRPLGRQLIDFCLAQGLFLNKSL